MWDREGRGRRGALPFSADRRERLGTRFEPRELCESGFSHEALEGTRAFCLVCGSIESLT